MPEGVFAPCNLRRGSSLIEWSHCTKNRRQVGRTGHNLCSQPSRAHSRSFLGGRKCALNNLDRVFFCAQSFGLIRHEKAVDLHINMARLKLRCQAILLALSLNRQSSQAFRNLLERYHNRVSNGTDPEHCPHGSAEHCHAIEKEAPEATR